MAEMEAVASAVGEMKEVSRERLARAMATIAEAVDGPGYEELAARRDELLAVA